MRFHASGAELRYFSPSPQTALQIAAAVDQHLIVRDLLGHGARLDTRDLWGRSPLHLCAERGHALSLQVRRLFEKERWQRVHQVFWRGHRVFPGVV